MTVSLSRGKPAVAGFSVTVSSYLRQHIARAQLAQPSAPYAIKDRWRLFDSVAHEPAAVGDQDPRIRSLYRWTVAEFGRDATSWAPGPEQLAVLGLALVSSPNGAGSPGFSLDGGALLNALADAAGLDIERRHERQIAVLKRGEDLPPTHAAILAEANARADNAERALAEARQQVENLRQAHVAEKARRREYQALVQGGPPQNVTPVGVKISEPEETPKGVYRRGDRFEAVVLKSESADGRQVSLGKFDTVDEAVQARDERLQVAA